MNEGKRLLSVFISPRALFQEIKEKPRWVLPFFISVFVAGLSSLIVSLGIPLEVWIDTFSSVAIPSNVPMEQSDFISLLAKQARVMSPIMGLLLFGIGNLFIAFFLWLSFKIIGGEITFKKSMSISSYASLITALGMILVMVIRVLTKDLIVNVSFVFLPFLRQDTFLFRVAYRLDFFSMWQVIVLGLGYHEITSKSRVTSFVLIVVLWIAYVCLRAFLNLA